MLKILLFLTENAALCFSDSQSNKPSDEPIPPPPQKKNSPTYKKNYFIHTRNNSTGFYVNHDHDGGGGGGLVDQLYSLMFSVQNNGATLNLRLANWDESGPI